MVSRHFSTVKKINRFNKNRTKNSQVIVQVIK